jgi:hypothetical protein
MRLEDVGDADTLGARRLQVAVRVTQRIDQTSDAVAFGDQQVGAIAQALVHELANTHGLVDRGRCGLGARIQDESRTIASKAVQMHLCRVHIGHDLLPATACI